MRYAIQRKQAEQAAVALQAERVRAEENARLERGLLPTPLLQHDADRRARPATGPAGARRTLGGDFFDVVEADDSIVHAVIGDVCGHGPDEAALGVCLRIAWRTLVLSGLTGAALLRRLERILRAERGDAEVFTTVSTLMLEPDQRTVRVWRAGHPGRCWCTPGRAVLAPRWDTAPRSGCPSRPTGTRA